MTKSIDIHLLKPHDIEKFLGLLSVFEITFEMKNFKQPNISHLQNLLAKDNFMAIVALEDNKVIAGLTIHVLDQYYSEKPLAYIYDVAVLPEYQRKGVGKKLMTFTNDYCKQKGFEEVFVQADKEDDHAIAFYRVTKPTAETEAIQFSYLLTDDQEN